MTDALLWAVALAVVLPSPSPPSSAGLAPGYFVTPHGCVTSMAETSYTPTPLLPPANPQTHTGQADTDDRYRARYAASLGHFEEAADWYARALDETALTGIRAYDADYFFRVPLSIALYRAGRIVEARAQWRTLLQRQDPTIDGGTKAALRGDYKGAFAAYAVGSDGHDPAFGDSGAEYNLQRGLNAAAQSRYQDARTYLEYSLECSAYFQPPHLILGVMKAMNGDYTHASREWIATLEGWVPSPSPTRLSQAQADALTLLLHFD